MGGDGPHQHDSAHWRDHVRVSLRCSCSPGPFQGDWRGSKMPRTCSGDCSVVSFNTPSTFRWCSRRSDPLSRAESFHSQSVTVQGSAAGNAVTLDGHDRRAVPVGLGPDDLHATRATTGGAPRRVRP